VITFDDGLAGNSVYDFEILEKFEPKATFFRRMKNISKKEYMNWEQYRILSGNNHSIQSHPMTHRLPGDCGEN
jgi:peptidoglycan/xylan/chitin deacetylase (PgdA/CDA1 family)